MTTMFTLVVQGWVLNQKIPRKVLRILLKRSAFRKSFGKRQNRHAIPKVSKKNKINKNEKTHCRLSVLDPPYYFQMHRGKNKLRH